MELFFNPFGILVGTLVSLLFHYVWFFLLFRKRWQEVESTISTEKNKDTTYLSSVALYSFVAYGGLVAMYALMCDLFSIISFKGVSSFTLLLTLSFVVIPLFLDMIYTTEGVHYDRKRQTKFLIRGAYYLLLSMMIAAILFLFK